MNIRCIKCEEARGKRHSEIYREVRTGAACASARSNQSAKLSDDK